MRDTITQDALLAHHLIFQLSVFLLNAQRLPLDLTAVASSPAVIIAAVVKSERRYLLSSRLETPLAANSGRHVISGNGAFGHEQP
jgi:hypothetical protein